MSDFIKKHRFGIDGGLRGGENQHITASFKTAVVDFLGKLKGSNESYAYRLAGKTLARELAAGSIRSSYAGQEIVQLTKSISAVCNFNATVWNSLIKTDTTAKCLETALAQEAKKKFNRPFATLDEFRQNQVFFEIVEQLIEASPKLRYYFFYKPFRKFLRWTVGLALLNLPNRQQTFEFVPDFRRAYISRGASLGSEAEAIETKKSKRKSSRQSVEWKLKVVTKEPKKSEEGVKVTSPGKYETAIDNAVTEITKISLPPIRNLVR